MSSKRESSPLENDRPAPKNRTFDGLPTDTSYVKLAQQYPSAGGIATFLMKAYGKGTITAAMSLLMYFSMVINESLVARTFGTYTLQLFDTKDNQFLVPALGVGLLVAAFIVNILGNKFIGTFSTVAAVIKIAGVLIFAAAGLWVSGLTFESVDVSEGASAGGFLSAVALNATITAISAAIGTRDIYLTYSPALHAVGRASGATMKLGGKQKQGIKRNAK